MKKLLLSTCLIASALFMQAQVIFYVNSPAELEGDYEMTWAEPDSWGMTPDLNDPDQSVTGDLVLAEDTSVAHTACDVLTNSAEIAGNIAILYRGTCEFGLKALNAQNAGAIAVVIVNNIPGAPIAMGGGANGGSVTIPVVMVSDVTGAMLVDAMEEGPVNVFIGNKLGIYDVDLGAYANQILRPKASMMPASLIEDEDDYPINIGAWITNFGAMDQTGATLSAVIMDGDEVIYEATSETFDLASGDSTYITLAEFSTVGLPVGYYSFTYTINIADEEFPGDNIITSDFMITEDMFSYARINPETMLPAHDAGYQPADWTGGANNAYQICTHLYNDNTSNVEAQGIWFSASAGSAGTLADKFISGGLYEWNLDFANVTELTAFNFPADFTQLATLEFIFSSDDQAGEIVYGEFLEPIQLEDGKRYAFCVSTESSDVYFGFSSNIDYSVNYDAERGYDQPMFSTITGGNSYLIGFGNDIVPTLTAKLVDLTSVVELETVKGNLYPNPAVNNNITITNISKTGAASLDIHDITGKLVKSTQVNVSANHEMTVDISGMTNGTYVLTMTFADNSTGTFKLVVSK